MHSTVKRAVFSRSMVVLQCVSVSTQQPCITRSTGWVSRSVTFKLCLLTYKCLHGLAPDYLSRFCMLLTSVPGRPLLRSADANKLLVPRSCTASFRLRSFGSSGLTAWNDICRLICATWTYLLEVTLDNCWKPLCSRLFRCSLIYIYRARLRQLIC